MIFINFSIQFSDCSRIFVDICSVISDVSCISINFCTYIIYIVSNFCNICFYYIDLSIYIVIDLINDFCVIFSNFIVNCCVDVSDRCTNFTFQVFDGFFIFTDSFFVINDTFAVFHRNSIVESNVVSVFFNFSSQISNSFAIIVNINS